MTLYLGLHHPSDAKHFPCAMISVNTLKRRKGPFEVNDWITDSGAFAQMLRHGGYPEPQEAYATEILRWANNGRLLPAVGQDFMCEQGAHRPHHRRPPTHHD